MLINYVPGEECRIAIVEDGVLEEFYQERASTGSHVSNIYKGRVTNIEPSIQAAFVDFGLERNGFLHISDLHPMYFPGKDREEFEQVGSKTPRRDRPPIQRCLRRGQEVLVQVLKEGIGTKGPTVTSYLSIPGRFLVMMPHMQRLGVSRKVDDDEARRKMRDILKDLNPPDDFGFIIRTAGMGQTKTELKRDLAYLTRLWKSIERKRHRVGKVGELYAESDLVIRTLRDVFTTDIDRVVVDHPKAAKRAHDFLAIANPRSKSMVVYYNDPIPLFHRFGVERQIDTINAREVPLKSGGALVIDQTEALVAIDVNSGKSREARDAEANAYNTNQEAVDEICRQLRLRDLGGLIVLDLIDMMAAKHRRSIEQQMRNNLKRDRARTKVGPISQFGLLEMTRQRMRPSLRKSIYSECGHCSGRGYTMSVESVVLSVMRRLALAMQHKDIARLELTISPDVAFHLLNRKRADLTVLEQAHNVPVLVRVGGHTLDHVTITASNERGGTIDIVFDGDFDKLSPTTETSFMDVAELRQQMPPEEDDLDLGDEIEPITEDVDDERAGEGEDERGRPTDGQAAAEEATGDEDAARKKRRRRRRGGRGRGRKQDEGAATASETGMSTMDEAEGEGEPAADAGDAATVESADHEDESAEGGEQPTDEGQPAGGKRRRRRRRRKPSRDTAVDNESAEAPSEDVADQPADDSDQPSEPADASDEGEEARPKKKRRRRRGKKKSAETSGESTPSATDSYAGSSFTPFTPTSSGYSNRILPGTTRPQDAHEESPE